MRPMFADTVVTEAGVDLDGPDPTRPPASRPEAYREWRRTRVLFMHSVSDAERAVVPGVADLPAQPRRDDL